jgi:hypothetical protein
MTNVRDTLSHQSSCQQASIPADCGDFVILRATRDDLLRRIIQISATLGYEIGRPLVQEGGAVTAAHDPSSPESDQTILAHDDADDSPDGAGAPIDNPRTAALQAATFILTTEGWDAVVTAPPTSAK